MSEEEDVSVRECLIAARDRAAPKACGSHVMDYACRAHVPESAKAWAVVLVAIDDAIARLGRAEEAEDDDRLLRSRKPASPVQLVKPSEGA